MIPRRRIEIEAADIGDFFAAPFLSHRRHRDVHVFEGALAAYLGCPQVRAVSSGRDALRVILAALELRPGDEIVIPAYTLGELVPFLQRDGYRPIAADVDSRSYNVTVDTVAAALTPRTRAILVLHAFGAPCDIVGIGELARTHAIPLIEDCAHALGATAGARKVGTFGRAGFFSFEVNKPVATFGGGIVATADAELARRIDGLIDRRPATEWPALRKAAFKMAEEMAVRSPLYGVAAALMFSERRSGAFERHYRRFHDRVRTQELAYSGFQARVGLRRLRRLDQRNAQMNAHWEELRRRLDGTPLVPQQRDRFGTPAFYNFAAAVPGALAPLRDAARRAGIDIAIRGEAMDDVAALLGQGGCPNAAALFGSLALLPLHGGVAPLRLDAMAQRLRTVLAAVR